MILEQIAYQLRADERLKGVARLGLCRVWSDKAMVRIEEMTNGMVMIEAREVEMEIGLAHTFIRAVCNGEEPFLYDGTGVSSYPPYFGPESQAPEHLLGSRPDMINNYRKTILPSV